MTENLKPIGVLEWEMLLKLYSAGDWNKIEAFFQSCIAVGQE